MTDDCIFCRIIDGDIPSRTVYEDEDVFAFLDVNPLATGHTLVIPKAHHERLDDLSTSASSNLFDAVHALTPAIETAVDADASTIGINNGPAAGQEVPHVHVHIVPRFDGDGGGPIHAIAPDRPDPSDHDLDGTHEAIVAAIDQ